MHKQLIFHNKKMDIQLSKHAFLQSKELDFPLLIEIQIYFSCLLGKRLAFYTGNTMVGAVQVEPELFSSLLDDSQHLIGNVYIRFNTVMTKACPVADYIGPPPVTDFEIINQTPYVPSWLNIDYKKDLWSGSYGWPSSSKKHMNTKQIRSKPVSKKNNINT